MPIPEADNAARCYRAATEALVETKRETVDHRGRPVQIHIWFLNSNVIAGNMDAVGRLFAANAEALRLTRIGRRRPACDWEIQLWSPLAAPIMLLHVQRQLAKLTVHAAEYEHLRGDDAEAVELLLDAVVFTDRVSDPRGSRTSYLVGQGASLLVTSEIEAITPSLTIADAAPSPSQSTSPASRSQVVDLIAELLDETEQRAGWADAWLGERLYTLDSLDALCAGRLGFRAGIMPTRTTRDWWEFAVRLAMEPLWRLDAVRLLEYATKARTAALAPNWPQAACSCPSSVRPGQGCEDTCTFPTS